MGCDLGYWSVRGQKFYQKPQALLKAMELNEASVQYHYYDSVWDSFDRSVLGKRPLDDIYRERAQQLRDSYDYLILSYSGGWDSRNILNTFIKNNIKLDCVHFKWPMKFVDNNFYTISRSTSSLNFLCEWDLVVKFDLNWLRKNHPEIRLEIVDWTDMLLSKDTFSDSQFDHIQQFSFMSSLCRHNSHSAVEREMVDKGHRVAVIYGVDKPVVELDSDNSFYLRFADTAPTVCLPRLYNPNGNEYFYWTPDMPLLVFEQANQILKYLELNPQDQQVFGRDVDPELLKSLGGDTQRRRHELLHAKLNDENKLLKKIVYSEYDPNLFQADKPMRSSDNFKGNTKDFFLETNNQVTEVKKIWHGQWQSWLGQFKNKFQSPPGWFSQCKTKRFYVGKLNPLS